MSEANATATEPGDKPGKPSYDKLFALAKSLKIKTKKQDKEIELLKKEIEEKSGDVGVSRSKDRVLNSEKNVTVSISKDRKDVKGDSGSGPPLDKEIFWESISKNDAFVQNLGRNCLNRMLSVLLDSNLGKNRLRLLSTGRSLKVAFSLLKQHVLVARTQVMQNEVMESSKSVKESESKITKLKALLARTHNANKQQLQDTKAFQRAQQSASEELRANAAEKANLLEEVRARDIQSAFQQDMEIYLQKLAEDVSKEQRMNKEQSTDTLSDIATDDKDTTSNSNTDSVNKDLELLKNEKEELLAKVDEQAKSISDLKKQIKDIASAKGKLEGSEKELRIKVESLNSERDNLQMAMEEEQYQKKELELELEVTLKSRVDMMSQNESVWRQKQEKITEESSTQIELLRKQCEQNEKQVTAAQSALEAALKEVVSLKKSNDSFQNSNDEVVRLRKQILLLKQSASSATRKSDSLDKNSAIKLVKNASAIVKYLKFYRFKACKSEGLIKAIGDMVYDNIGGSVPETVTDANCTDYNRIKLKLEKKIEETKDELSDSSKKVEDEPMIWESSKLEINAGNTFPIILPLIPDDASSSDDKKPERLALLMWSYTTMYPTRIEVYLLNSNTKQKLTLVSEEQSTEATTNEKIMKGRIAIPFSHQKSASLVFENKSWGSIVMGYKAQFRYRSRDSDTGADKEMETKLITEQRRYGRFMQACHLKFKMDQLMQDRNFYDSDATCDEEITSFVDAVRSSAVHLSLDDCVEIFEDSSEDNASALHEGVTFSDYEASLDPIRTLQCESLMLNARKDFRIELPFEQYPVPFRLSWLLELPNDNQKALDVGFSVMEKRLDGSLPQLLPYKLFKRLERGQLIVSQDACSAESVGIVILFDNTYSIMRSKEIRYSFKVETLIVTQKVSNASSLDKQDDAIKSPSTLSPSKGTDKVLLDILKESIDFQQKITR